jgi:hypothetical protein
MNFPWDAVVEAVKVSILITLCIVAMVEASELFTLGIADKD